ncbi:MAG: ROK family protein, partial [Staphylococcus simulans]|nr:ROK family protein [Staphylococcus simulans]
MNQIAIDIGGTNIKAALINENQEIKDYKKISTPDNVQTLIIDEVYQLAHELITKHKLNK